jgi:hypothetical protein
VLPAKIRLSVCRAAACSSCGYPIAGCRSRIEAAGRS